MLSYIDPIPGGGHSVHFIPKETAIAQMQAQARDEWYHRQKGPYSDAMALQDFVTVNWAEELNVTIERMAQAMWAHWHNASSTMMKVQGWEDGETNRDPWREQAKAALKALGVPLP